MFLTGLRALTRCYPFQVARGSLSARLPDVPRGVGAFQAKRKIKYVAYATGQDFIVKNLFWFGEFEPWVIMVIGFLVRPNEVVCDIGANMGDTALQLFSYVGSSVYIYCFEPVPLLCKCLSENLKANHVSSVIIVPYALSDWSGQSIMVIPKKEPGHSSLIDAARPNLCQETIKVEVTTLDTWLRKSGIPQVACCKIDVEGHELEVLRGMKDALNSRCIGSIVFERHKDCDARDPVIELLCHHNYRVFRLYKGLLKVGVVELGYKRKYLQKTDDYVAVIEGSVFEERLRPLIKSVSQGAN